MQYGGIMVIRGKEQRGRKSRSQIDFAFAATVWSDGSLNNSKQITNCKEEIGGRDEKEVAKVWGKNQPKLS